MNEDKNTDEDFERIKRNWACLSYWQKKEFLFRCWLIAFPRRLAIRWVLWQIGR